MFEDEKARASYVLDEYGDNSISDLLSIDDIKVDRSERSEQPENGQRDNPDHLTKRESDAALTMSSRANRGFLKKTEGTWCFW